MGLNLDSFLKDQEHEQVHINGNKPLLLNDKNSVWVVLEGNLTVFMVTVNTDGSMGSRKYLLEAVPGMVLPGIQSYGEKTKIQLIASAVDSNLARFDINRFLKAFENDTKGSLEWGIKQWIEKVSEALGLDDSVQKQELLDSLHNNEMAKKFELFNVLALKACYDKRLQDEDKEILNIDKKYSQNKQFMSEALNKLASVSGDGNANSKKVADDPLYEACKKVCEKFGIEVKKPRPERMKNTKDPLAEIARASRIRVRQVALKGKWWNEDCGPMLAYIEDDGRPVALLQVSSNVYEMYDPAKGESILIKDNNASMIRPFAFMFYNPFPSRIIRLKDILVFSMKGAKTGDLIMVFTMGLIGGILGMVNPMVSSMIFDNVIPQAERAQLMQIGFLLLSIAIGKAMFDLTKAIAMLRFEGKMDATAQSAVWDRLISLPAPFFRDYSAGELAMRAMGVDQIRKTLSGTTVNAIISGIFSIFNGLLMFKYDVKMSWIAMGLVLIAILTSLFLGWIQIKYQRKVVDITNKISGLVLQLIAGVSKLRVAGAESRAFYQWSKLFTEQRTIEFSKKTISNVLTTFNTMFPVVSSMVIFYIMGNYTGSNALTTGNFIAFNSSYTTFATAMLQLSSVLLTVNMIIPTYESTKPILEALPEFDEDKEDPGELDGSIDIRNITFRYKEDAPIILNDISMNIEKGDYVALVGSSGCGKSTLLRLLLGFEKPESGKVYYSGKDLDSVDVRAVRKQLGVVLQNGQLMSGEIYTNIIGSNPNLTVKDAEAAAKMAGLYDDIQEMPMGMHTVVSEGGGTLSGGQRQRLLIARAIVNKPSILFFDEATSALDNNTQAIVSKSLDSLNATRIVIAHRLSTVINCNRIIVLDKGSIVEEGSYDELMKKDGLFAQLAKRQLA